MKTTIRYFTSVLVLSFLGLFLGQNSYAQNGLFSQKRDSLIHKRLPNYQSDPTIVKDSTTRKQQSLLKAALLQNPDYLRKSIQAVEWLEHSVESQWDTTQKSYSDIDRTYYAYDQNDNQKENLIQALSSGQWQNYYRYLYTHNSDNTTKEELEMYWSGSDWINLYLTQYAYNTAGQKATQTIKNWYAPDWVNNYQIQFTYNTSGKLKEELHQVWDGTEWVNYGRIDYAYDAAGNDTAATIQMWQYEQWINYSKDTYEYNTSNQVIEEYDLYWDGITWQNNYHISYNYSGSNVSKMILSYWYFTQWENSDQILFSYNTDNKVTKATYQVWDGNIWINDYLYSLTYNSNGNNLETLEKLWLNDDWTNYWRTSYVYTSTRPDAVPTPIAEDNVNQPDRVQLFQNYPNPFNPSTQIKYNLPSAQNVQIRIYDITGRLVSTLVNKRESAGEHIITFQNHNLSSGMYLYQLQTGNKTITKKMLLIK